MKVHLEYRAAYGKTRFAPLCDAGKALIGAMGTNETFSLEQVEKLADAGKLLGFEVYIQSHFDPTPRLFTYRSEKSNEQKGGMRRIKEVTPTH